ncbi:3-hydroxybenzoate 6-hydroxylase 1 [Streptomyces sp. RB5]|uniref:3-hydroxybenzoate 6-hydroxylase 1 n=1 Tax=Streptomyces smaragdinus TaxID=2585196 RepID=A0A7K0CHK7_9ACTN|nr:FAD-dependent monooxygenase [Streptomyces smaragdinus]MQY12482.1 3-hydroxybenzoate 6-hydroxylase 1 [Streptomyces smaragdinus]
MQSSPTGADGSTERITVIGAGIGGLTLAAALTRHGRSFRLYEKTRRLAEVGAGTQLSPNAVRPLLELGLGPALRECAVPIRAMEVRGHSGRLIARTPLGAECARLFGAPYLTVHRAHLHAALVSAIDRDRLRLGRRLAEVRETEGGALLGFEDGAVLRAGVTVGADGLHSAVRAVFRRDAPVASGTGMYRGLLPMTALPAAAREPVVRIWLGPGGHFVCYPVAAGEQLSFAATVSLPDPADGEQGQSRAAQVFGGWRGLVADIAAAGVGQRWPVSDRDPLDTWSRGRVTLLGDAAHPMLPFLAQATSQAVEDAVELAACLAETPAADADEALARYAALRGPRARALQRAARRTAGLLHLPDGPAQRRRDALFAESAALPERGVLFAHQAGRRSLPTMV